MSEEKRKKYNDKAREKKKIETEEREKDQATIDRIKYLFQHKVHLFPHDSGERKELVQAISNVLKRPKPITWRPILPRNSEPVHIFDIFDLLEKTKHH